MEYIKNTIITNGITQQAIAEIVASEFKEEGIDCIMSCDMHHTINRCNKVLGIDLKVVQYGETETTD